MTERCPECGRPIMETWHAASEGDLPEHLEATAEIEHQWMQAVATAVGYPVDAILFVNDAVTDPTAPVPSSQVDARAACDAFARHVRRYFRNDSAEARACLAEWRLSSREDVGRVLLALAAEGLARVSPGTNLQDFAGQFRFDDFLNDGGS